MRLLLSRLWMRLKHVASPIFNRLWVRLSLIISSLLIVVIVLPLLVFIGLASAGVIDIFERGRNPQPRNAPLITDDGISRRVLRQVPEGMISITVVVTLIGLGTGIWISRSLSAPISKLAEASQAIGARDLSYRIEPSGTQEMIDLAHTFNQMAADLEQAESLRRNLMADVSHELRTPLTVLEGNLRAALDRVYQLDEAEIAHLYQQTRHLIRLVDDLHELAQAEAKQLSLNIQKTDVIQIGKEALAIFEPLAQEKDIYLKRQFDLDVPFIKVDGARVRQILHNLLSNALRHTPTQGTVRLNIRAESSDNIVIEVADSGEGIDPEQVPHIFDRFYRVDRSRSRNTGGTGLGLAIVKAIVEAHKGTLMAHSEGLNRGTTFTIYLPVN